MESELQVSKKYWRTTMIMILVLGAIMLGFWYFSFGLEQFWIPSGILVFALASFNYLIMPKMNGVLHKIYSKKK